MKLFTTIKRPKGTNIKLDNPTAHYHFKPSDEDERHIAEVPYTSHILLLLRHEHFVAVNPEEVESLQPDGEHDQDLELEVKLIGSTIHNASYTAKSGDVITLDELVAMACEESGLTPKEWNETLADQERYAMIDQVLSELMDGTFESAAQQNALIAQQVAQTITPPAAPAPAAEPAAPAPAPAPAPAAVAVAPAAPATLDREALAAEFKERFGRMPNGRMTAENIHAVLEKDKD